MKAVLIVYFFVLIALVFITRATNLYDVKFKILVSFDASNKPILEIEEDGSEQKGNHRKFIQKGIGDILQSDLIVFNDYIKENRHCR